MLFAVGERDDVLEVPRLQGADHEQQAREMSILRTWNVREGVDATPTPLAPPAPLPDVPAKWVVPDTEPRTGGGDGVEALIRSYDWDADTALRIAGCESGYRSDAVSWDGTSFGVMQLYAPIWASVFPDFWDMWMDAAWNIARGWDIYVRAGYSFRPWACWR